MNKGLFKAISIFAVTVVAVLCLATGNRISAQSGNGISEPADGDSVSGIIVIRGTADHPQFLRYELAFQQSFGAGSDWIVFAQGDQPVRDNTLAVWDTTVGQPVSPVFPDGTYRLRLRVVREDYNYDEYFVSNIVIANLSATPTPDATLTTTLPLPATLPSAAELEGTRRAATGTLPTLTPFPTPSPLPTVAEGVVDVVGVTDGESDQQGGLLNRILEVETSRFGEAFWLGVRLVFGIFACLAAYILLRWVWRKARRSLR